MGFHRKRQVENERTPSHNELEKACDQIQEDKELRLSKDTDSKCDEKTEN